MSDPVKLAGQVQPGMPRIRTCCRCESRADAREQNGLPRSHVHEAQSWVKNGIRYWSGTCIGCANEERTQRENTRIRNGVKEKDR